MEKYKTLDYRFFFHEYPFYTHVIQNEPAFKHSHSFIECFYILDGNCSNIINDVRINLQKGDLIILRTHDYHACTNSNAIEGKRRDILFENDFFKSICEFIAENFYEKFLANDTFFKTQLSTQKIAELENTILKINHAMNSGAKKQALSLIKIFCVKLIEQFLSPKVLIKNNVPLWIDKLVAKLNDGVYISTPLNELLSSFNYNHTYAQKMFKKYTGVTMSEYRLNVQLQYAANLLKTTDLSVSLISEKSGFAHTPYFYKTFKKKFGITPLQLKKTFE